MQSLSERTAGFTDSVIRRMTRVSMQYDAVNLSQGFPDFEPPKELLDRLAQVAYEDYHQYSITWGSQNFREALAAKQTYFMGRRIDPDTEIVTTCGSTEAMMAAMMTVTNPGDKVIIFSPFYENYGADTILSGAEPIYVPLVPPDFHFDAKCAGGRVPSAPEGHHPVQPIQPVRQGVHPRGAGDYRVSRRSTIPTLSPTRCMSISYSHPTSTLILPLCRACGSARCRARRSQDVLGYRLATGLHHRSAGDHRPREKVHDFLTVGAARTLQEAVATGLKMGQDYYDDLQAKYTHKRTCS